MFHAAALKEVPSCEFFPMEAVRTNIIGTDNVITAAVEAGVQRVVFLSTDKAAYTSLSQLLNIVRTSIVTASFASGYSGTISGGQIEFFGVVWFLVSLFIGRSLFDYMQLRLKEHPKHLLGGVILLSIVGVCRAFLP